MPAQTQKQNDRNPFEGLLDDEDEVRYTRKTTRTKTRSKTQRSSTQKKKPKGNNTGKYILIGCMCVVALAANRILFHSGSGYRTGSGSDQIQVEPAEHPSSPITGKYTLDGTEYEELTPIRDFLEDGWVLDDDYGYIDSDGYIDNDTTVHLVMKKGYSQSFDVYVSGFEEDADKINVEEAYVTGISVDSDSNIDFVTSIGISSDMSEEEMVEILKDSGNGYNMYEYTYTYGKEKNVSHYYYSDSDFDDGWYNLNISFYNGELHELEQSAYYYDPPNLK